MSNASALVGSGATGILAADSRRGRGRGMTQRRSAAGQRSPLRRMPRPTPLRMATILVVDPDRATREPLRTSLPRSASAGSWRRRRSPRSKTSSRGRSAATSPWSACNSGRTPAGWCTPLREAGWPRVIALAPTADIGPVIDAVGAGVSGVLIGRRANPAAASDPQHDPRPVQPGDRGHPAGRRRPVQQVDRRAALAVGADREEPPGPDRSQARHRRSRAHGRPGDAGRRHLLIARVARVPGSAVVRASVCPSPGRAHHQSRPAPDGVADPSVTAR